MKNYNLKIDEAFSDMVEGYAMQLNLASALGNSEDAAYYADQLFRACYGSNGHKLLQIRESALQPVGLAFVKVAIHFDFNDLDLNSVAAENALYCLGASVISKHNTYCAPAIFTLLLNHSNLLRDKLIAAHCTNAERETGMFAPIRMMLGGNPYTAPHLNEFRTQAVSKRVFMMSYLLTMFYDINSRKYTIPSDLSYHLPKEQDIDNYIALAKAMDAGANSAFNLKEGEKYFNTIVEECGDTLSKMV